MHILNAWKLNSDSTHNYAHAGATNHKPISTLNHFQSYFRLHAMHPIVMHAMNEMQCKREKPKRKPTHRDKVSSQGLLGNQEPNL